MLRGTVLALGFRQEHNSALPVISDKIDTTLLRRHNLNNFRIAFKSILLHFRYTRRMLLCSVRGCRLALMRQERRLVCARGHSFDIARSGYINLLQPQDRRSRQPGDTKAAVAARRRLHDLGVTGPLLRGIADIIAAHPGDIVLDAGCGDGFYLGTLAREIGFDAHGVDISTFAIDAAARRYPPSERCEWVVANADRFVPYADRFFSIVLSITARMNVGEFRRVLHGPEVGKGGRLLVALPSPEDLAELRSHIGESGRDRVARTVETFAPGFTLAEQRRVTSAADLSAASVHDVLLSIYRPMRSHPVEAVRLTFSLDLLLFRPR
jgi:23S rRNA (guanine745-N1)-methyltransferase